MSIRNLVLAMAATVILSVGPLQAQSSPPADGTVSPVAKKTPPRGKVAGNLSSKDARLGPEARNLLRLQVPYRIGAGDVLQINVWKEPDASVPSVVVRADGKISLPLVKEVEVAGLTPDELEKVLTERLTPFIHGADVSVIVKEIHSQKVYVIGGVKHEGVIRLEAPITVLEVLAQSGGLTEYAKKRKIYVLRGGNGRQTRLPFDYEAVVRGLRPEQNIVVVPGDTIIVPH